jgi:hypothetical protein
MLAHGAGVPASLKDAEAGQKALRTKDRKSEDLLEGILLELRATNWLLAEAFKLNNPSGDLP